MPEIIAELQRKHAFSCPFASHDLGVVEQMADRVVVVHEERSVEHGPRDAIFDAPQQPYTRQLLAAVPGLETPPEGGVRWVWRTAPHEPVTG